MLSCVGCPVNRYENSLQGVAPSRSTASEVTPRATLGSCGKRLPEFKKLYAQINSKIRVEPLVQASGARIRHPGRRKRLNRSVYCSCFTSITLGPLRSKYLPSKAHGSDPAATRNTTKDLP